VAQEQTADENGAIRKKAMARLVVAGMVTAAALGALWWLDNSGKPAKSTPAKTASPIVTAPIAPPPEPISAEPEPTAASTPTEPPPPPEVGTPAMSAASEGAAASPKSRPALPAPASAPARAAPHPMPMPPPSSETPRAYIVQLGVFADPGNAKELVERLSKAGVRAQMETRVQLGPFQNRQEADKARAEMARIGFKGVVATK
jgi:DedD protein